MEGENSSKIIYAKPYLVKSIDECDFYHYMDIPGNGAIVGKWDLRNNVDKYLGDVVFKEKRVLELGTASGFLCFEMEKRGAEVVAFDIGENCEWDIIPFAQYDYKLKIEEFKCYCNRMKNAYWFAHKALNSNAKAVYGSIYDIPKEIGSVDIATFCSILLHLRDPFLALQSASSLVKQQIIITDLVPDGMFFPVNMFRRAAGNFFRKYLFKRKEAYKNNNFPYMEFLPDFKTLRHKDTWWSLSPEIIINFLGVLGFEETRVTYHFQKLYGKKKRLFTIVGKRTKNTMSVEVMK